MSMNDTLAAAMSAIENAEKLGKQTCTISPSSRIIKDVLGLMRDKHYLGEYKEGNESKGGVLVVNLLGKINKCGAIKPRFSIKKDGFERFEKRYLPARDFGFIIISTSQGLMVHADAKRKNLGGRLMVYFY